MKNTGLLILALIFLACTGLFGQTTTECDIAWPSDCQLPGIDEPGFNTMFVSKQSYFGSPFRFLDCSNEGDELVSYAKTYNFNHLVFYGIKDYLDDYLPAKVSNLRRLIRACHDNGLTVSLTVGKYENATNIRLFFDDPNTKPNEQYDALCMESEPWNSVPDMSWTSYYASISKHRAFCNARQRTFEVYIGNPSTQAQVNQIAAAAHRIYATYYKSHPCDNSDFENIFHSKLSRLELLANASPAPAHLSILFSAKDSSADPNMAAWIKDMKTAHPNLSFLDILKLPFRRWYACGNGYRFNKPTGTQDHDIDFEIGSSKLDIVGHAWYSYQDLRLVTGPFGQNNACGGYEENIVDRGLEKQHDEVSSTIIRQAPGANNIFISVPSEVLDQGVTNYIIYDINGRILGQGVLSHLENNIDTQDLDNGVYFVAVFNKVMKYRQVEKFCRVD